MAETAAVVLDARRAVADAEGAEAMDALLSAWAAQPSPLPLAVAVGAWKPAAAPTIGVRLVNAPGDAAADSAVLWLASENTAPAFGAARLAIVPTRHAKVQLQTLRGYPAHRTLTLPWGVDVVEFATRSQASRRILMVQPKTPGAALAAWANEFAGLGEVVALGPGGTATQRRQAIASAGCVVLLDHEVAYGFDLHEALALGVPVVASDLPPLNEAPRDRVHWADADRAGSLRAAVENALAAPRGDTRSLAPARTWRDVAAQLNAVLLDSAWSISAS